MQRFLPVGVLILMLLSLQACIPMTGDYYAPSAHEGEVGTYGDWYAPNTFRVKRGDNVVIAIHEDMIPHNSNYKDSISVEIMLPPDGEIHLPINEIKVTSKGGDIVSTQESLFVNTFGQLKTTKMDITEDYLRGSKLPGNNWTQYTAGFVFDSPIPEVFYVDLPAMQVGDTKYPPLKVLFTLTHGWWIQPLL